MLQTSFGTSLEIAEKALENLVTTPELMYAFIFLCICVIKRFESACLEVKCLNAFHQACER